MSSTNQRTPQKEQFHTPPQEIFDSDSSNSMGLGHRKYSNEAEISGKRSLRSQEKRSSKNLDGTGKKRSAGSSSSSSKGRRNSSNEGISRYYDPGTSKGDSEDFETDYLDIESVPAPPISMNFQSLDSIPADARPLLPVRLLLFVYSFIMFTVV